MFVSRTHTYPTPKSCCQVAVAVTLQLPLLTPAPRNSDMTTQDRKVIVGPDMQEVRVQLKDAAYRRAVE